MKKKVNKIYFLLIMILFLYAFYLNKSTTKEGFKSNKDEYKKIDKKLKDLKDNIDSFKQSTKQNEKSIKKLMQDLQNKGEKVSKAANKVPSATWPVDHHITK